MLDNNELQAIIASINNLKDHTPYWKTFLTLSIPILISSMLGVVTGLGSALYLDRLKTRRENAKIVRERREKELALLSGANAAIAFNIEAITHTVLQQKMPHYEHSRAACLEISTLCLGRR